MRCPDRAGGATCLDGDPCTLGDSCEGGVCSGEPNLACQCKTNSDCAAHEDGDACNGTLFCEAASHQCKRNPTTVVACVTANDTDCVKNACSPTNGACSDTHAELVVTQCDDLGCRPVVATKPTTTPVTCDDADSCTANTFCKSGACGGGSNLCSCKVDKDCLQQEDGDVCNGTLYCDAKAGVCKVNPATIVACPTTADTSCTKNVCIPSSGQCAVSPVANGTICDDGDACTVGDVCVQGACNTGAKSVCPCQTSSDCDKHDDGDLCNGTLFCNQNTKQCQPDPSGVVTCPTTSDTACGKHVCAPQSGACVVKPRAAVKQQCIGSGDSKTCKWLAINPKEKPDDGPFGCEDGDACTKGDVCEGATCKSGTAACTCDKDSDCVDEDSDLCTGVAFCDKTDPKKPTCKNNPKTVVSCDKTANTGCLKAMCTPTTGKCTMKPEATGTLCDDGKPCTKGDFCSAGLCTSGTFVCPCSEDADCPDTDADKCTGVSYCDKSVPGKHVCKANPASAVFCAKSDDSACLKNTCDKITGKCGLKPTVDGAKCDDDNPCTAEGTCKGGDCSGLANVCACQFDADCIAKDDGDKCNGVPYCDKSGAKPACKANPASVVFCSPKDDSACLKNSCDTKTGSCGLKANADGIGCDDGDACTSKDACKGGKCAGATASCDDGDPCTKDSCDMKAGCLHGKVVCDAGNACSVDSCDSKSGKCVFDTGASQGKICNADDDGCTVNDACDKGACKPGTVVACASTTAQCQVAKCASSSATAFACVTTVAPDGAGCTDGKSCQIGAVCKGGKCQAGTADRLFAKGVADPKGGALTLQALVQTATGPVVAGRVVSGSAGAGKTGWWLARLDEAGAVQSGWPRIIKAATTVAGSTDDVGVVAVALESGGVAGVGSVVGKGGDLDLAVVVHTADGKSVTLDQQAGTSGLDERALGGLHHAGGGWLVVGESGKQGVGTARAWRLSAGGLLGWTWDAGVKGVLYGAAVASDGGAWVVGEDRAETAARGLVARLDGLGKKTGQWSLDHADAQGFSAVQVATGGAVLAGWRTVSGTARLWLVRVDDAGKVLWQRASSGKVQANALTRQGAGWVVAGYAPGVIGSDALLMGIDDGGHTLWQRSHDAGSDERATAVLADAAGQLSVVGQRGKAPSQGLVWTTSAWGQDSCVGAGACANQKVSDCVDGNGCTDDLCDPLSGCVASANTETCQDGNGCTTGDQCVNKSCQPGLHTNCDDANPCTKDTCDPKKGCQQTPLADLTPCETGKSCLAGVCSKRWAIDIAIGFQHSCVVGTDGLGRCWGDPFRGKTGNGGINPAIGKISEVVKVSDFAGITAGYAHTCGWTTDHNAWCWGDTSMGELGIGTTGYGTNAAPLLVVGAPDTRRMVAQSRMTCAIDGKGALRCWGQNQWKAIQKDGGSSVSSPVLLSAFGAVTDVAPGQRHVCALSTKGTVACAGDNTSGQLGLAQGLKSLPDAPVTIPGLSGVTAVTSGDFHTCAIIAGGKMVCWGEGSDGQLGNGTKSGSYGPSPVFGLDKVVDVCGGAKHTCAVREDGTAWCWGDNVYGQLGQGHQFAAVAPAKAKSLSDVIRVDCGVYHSCFLLKTGEVRCAGYNSYGQIGLGYSGYSAIPTPTAIPQSKP